MKILKIRSNLYDIVVVVVDKTQLPVIFTLYLLYMSTTSHGKEHVKKMYDTVVIDNEFKHSDLVHGHLNTYNYRLCCVMENTDI